MEHEYNDLTKKLLSEGYDAYNYPEYVRICASKCPGDNPLYNLAGGFEYKHEYKENFVYKTGCGKLVMGSDTIDSLTYCGIDWCHENNKPVIRCPFDIQNCEKNDKRLHGTHGGGLCIQCFCVCHRTEEQYEYLNSIEREYDLIKEEKERKYKEYSDLHNGRICRNHMYYNERTKQWSQQYSPSRCSYMCYSQDGYCPVLGRKLSRKKGNVYYDVRRAWKRKQTSSQQSLFDGEVCRTVEKGIRYFKKPCSIDICNAFVKVQKDEIERNYNYNHQNEKIINNTLEWEICNIRVESRPSRDIDQDLEDIRNGIKVSYEFEQIKEQKKRKKDKKTENEQKRIEKIEKKIIEVGYENLEERSMDKIHADKWLTEERITELENIRKEKLKEKENEPVQLSLF